MTQGALFGDGPDGSGKTRERHYVKREQAKPVLSWREISRYVAYYNKHVRLHNGHEWRGVFGAIQRILAGAPNREPITPQAIADAIKNYEKDPFVQSLPQRGRKHIRSFFTYENILIWRKPVVQKPVLKDPSLAALERVEQTTKAAPSAPDQPAIEDEEEVEF